MASRPDALRGNRRLSRHHPRHLSHPVPQLHNPLPTHLVSHLLLLPVSLQACRLVSQLQSHLLNRQDSHLPALVHNLPPHLLDNRLCVQQDSRPLIQVLSRLPDRLVNLADDQQYSPHLIHPLSLPRSQLVSPQIRLVDSQAVGLRASPRKDQLPSHRPNHRANHPRSQARNPVCRLLRNQQLPHHLSHQASHRLNLRLRRPVSQARGPVVDLAAPRQHNPR